MVMQQDHPQREMIGDDGGVDVDVVIIGAGFGGLYALHRLRKLGLRIVVFEAGAGVGGTWFWNRYPGARCDVPSVDYSYSFSPELDQEWTWIERYATQPEILRYLEHVADRFDLRRSISFGYAVTAMTFDEGTATWLVTTTQGTTRCRFVVSAVGCLSAAHTPSIPGLADFSGTVMHTADWPAGDVDFSGQRVGVVGTGSSGVQLIPLVAASAARTVVFQRTPAFCLPARNRRYAGNEMATFKRRYPEHRRHTRRSRSGLGREYGTRSALEVSPAERDATYERAWQAGGLDMLSVFTDLLTDPAANATLADFLRAKIRSIVRDPEVADRLTPRGFPIGAKRPCVGTDYYETYNRPDVELVDLRVEPIERISDDGIQMGDREIGLDTLVLATGFDAITGALARIDIRGRAGRALRDRWSDGPVAYLGLAVDGFPNLFLVTGPGSPSVLANVVAAIEQHVDWIADAIEFVRQRRDRTIEADAVAVATWSAHVRELADQTLFPQGNSWYVGANVPGKPRSFMVYVGGLDAFAAECDRIAADSYRGFVSEPAAVPGAVAAAAASGNG